MLHEIQFQSFNERDEVQGWIYVPACEPKGIIQLVHGFGEHSRRYLHMALAFAEAGLAVFPAAGRIAARSTICTAVRSSLIALA